MWYFLILGLSAWVSAMDKIEKNPCSHGIYIQRRETDNEQEKEVI
jgi:hypothetical protein